MSEVGTVRGRIAWRVTPRLVAAGLLLLPVGAATTWLQLLVLAALLVALGCAGEALAARWFPGLRAPDRALVTAACAVATALLAGVVLGHFGLLTGPAFRAVAALLAVATLWPPRAARGEQGPQGEGRGESPGRGFVLMRGSRVRRLAAGVVLAAAVASGAGVAQRIWHYRQAQPGRFSFDDTSYHLFTAATFHTNHDLRMPRFSYGDPRTTFYPLASELLAWELTTPFAGGDFAARWVELPFALLTLLATAVVARRLGAGSVGCLLAPLLYASVTEAVPFSALAAGNDHAVGFAVIAVVHAALLLRGRAAPGTGAYAGIAMGLLVGTKLVGLLDSPSLGLLVLLCLAVSRAAPGDRLRSRGVALAVCVGVALLVGGYTYLRNAATAGNPLFPVAIRLGPLSLPGWVDVYPSPAHEAPESVIDPWRFPWVRRELLGPLFRWTMLPALLLAPVVALLRRRSRRGLVVAWVVAQPLVLYLLFVALIEDHRTIRYLFGAVALAAVATTWLVTRLPEKWRWPLVAALAALASGRWVMARPGLLAVSALVLTVAWALARRRRAGYVWHPKPVAALALLAACLVAPSVARTVARYEAHRLDQEPAAGALATLTGGRAARVAYLGWNQPYLYCGHRLQNVVSMVPGGRHLDARDYRWGSDTVDPFGDPSTRRRWLRNLETLRIEYIVWVAQGGKSGPEHWWMEQTPALERRYGDGRVEVWRVRTPGALGSGKPPRAPRGPRRPGEAT